MTALAAMLAADKDALACDLWETYQVEDMEALPLKTLAMLSCGLRDDSRIKMILAKLDYSFDTILRARILDTLMGIMHALVGGEPPKSVYKAMMGIPDENDSEVVSYETADAWEAERQRIIGGGAKVSNGIG